MDSALNITIRVAGRQAQQQLRQVSNEIQKMQSMVGKQVPKLQAPFSPWSPRIAQQQAKQAAAAATQAANAHARATKQAATQAHKQFVATNNARARATKAAASQAHRQLVANNAATARANKAAATAATRQTAAANRAATAAAKAQTAATKAAATQAHKQMVAAQKAAQSHQMKVWNQQQAQHKAHLRTIQAQQTAANKTMAAQQKAQAAQQSKLSGLTPLGFAAQISKSALINAGKNINWVGRQLTYNFTLPLVLAGSTLMKFTMNLERSQTQIAKVYGDITDDPAMLRAELDALNHSFELLSSRFGVHQVEVLEIAAAWAAAGSAGVGLAENVRATLETMVLGDLDATAATEGLIAIQAQWGFSTQKNAEGVSDLTVQLAHLNAIENATGISTGGLIEVIQRAGGTARTSGAEFRELAALASALVPATGDAAQAGTALRSIISSLMAPTAVATEALELMGVTVTDPSFMGQDVMGRLRIVAEHFDDLSDAQKGVVSSTIATKWQVSRFDVLMRQIIDPMSFYNRALAVTADESQSLEIRQRELMTVLESHPKQWDIMMNVMRNTLADAFLPMIPAILSIVNLIRQAAEAFTNLSPETQKFILYGLLLIAVLGPLVSFFGSLMTLAGLLKVAFMGIVEPVLFLIKKALIPLIRTLGLVAYAFVRTALTAMWSFVIGLGPVGWAIIAALAAIVAAIVLILNTDLEDKIWDAMKSVGNALGQLPGIFASVFTATGKIIASAMTKITEALSYLNPFARHSPSLVDNVKAGVATILDEYKKLNRIPNMVAAAAAALEAFSTATDARGRSFREIELQKKADVTSMAMPSAQPQANALVQQILSLESTLPTLKTEILGQQFVVEGWTQALKRADAELKVMEDNLARLESEYDKIGDAIAAAEAKIDQLADTPIQGLQALEDQIFNNQHAQNLLNMELLEFEKRGLTLDSIRDKYAAMAGEIETLRGTQAELRGAGAGSDILSWYDQQISAIQAQRQEMSLVEQTITDIESRLDALDLEGRFLDLTKAINFDPLERQIDQIANKVMEMPFDEIVAQILEQQAIIEELQPQYETLGAAVERERAAVEATKAERDDIQEQLNLEEEKLRDLEEAYRDIEGLIRDMESALTDFATLLEQSADDASRIEELFDAAAGFDFEDFGGDAALGREGFLADIEEFNRLLEEELAEALANMGELDLVKPLQEAWEKVKTWFKALPQKLKELWNEYWPLVLAGVAVAIGMLFGVVPGLIIAVGLLLGALIYAFGDDIWDWVYENIIDPAKDWGWDLIDGFVQGCWDWINEQWQLFQDIWDKILNWIKDFFGISSPSTVMRDIGYSIMQGLYDGIMLLVQPIIGLFTTIFTQIWMVISILWGLVGAVISWVWETVIKPIWDEIKAFIDEKLVPAFNWLKEKAGEAWGLMGDAISLVWNTLIKPVFDAIKWTLEFIVVPAFSWAAGEIDRIWSGIGAGLQFVMDNVIMPIWDGFRWAFEHIIKPAFEFLRDSVIRPIMESIYNAIAHVWNGIAGVIEGGVNFFVSAFNLIADGVNAVAGFLGIGDIVPGLSPIHLDRMGEAFDWGGSGNAGGKGEAVAMAAGGVVDQRGGAYNVPTAIVGEGSTIHPEFVIPTDPRYRDRALGLMQALGTRLMQTGGTVDGGDPVGITPGSTFIAVSHSFDDRNIFQKAIDGTMDAITTAGGIVANGMVRGAWAGPSQAARFAIDQIPNKIFKQSALGIFEVVDRWVTNLGTDWDAAAELRIAPQVTQGSGSWKAIVEYLTRMGIPHKVLSTHRPGAVTRTTGKPSWHGMNRAIDLSGPEGMVNFSASTERIAAAIYGAFKGQLHELIWGGTQQYNVFDGASHMFSPALMREHYNHVHASLAAGGRFYVPHVPGGVNLNVAEGRTGEQIQILPVDENGSGGTTIIINGNLSFPNVSNGNDAKNFLENLKALAT